MEKHVNKQKIDLQQYSAVILSKMTINTQVKERRSLMLINQK